MKFALGVPKGMRTVLTERGIDASKTNADRMREVLGFHPDFTEEKSMLERFLVEERGHIMYYLPNSIVSSTPTSVYGLGKVLFTCSLQIHTCKSTAYSSSYT